VKKLNQLVPVDSVVVVVVPEPPPPPPPPLKTENNPPPRFNPLSVGLVGSFMH
jgi:hypothetical protein